MIISRRPELQMTSITIVSGLRLRGQGSIQVHKAVKGTPVEELRRGGRDADNAGPELPADHARGIRGCYIETGLTQRVDQRGIGHDAVSCRTGAAG
jgi:hypothetical protein